MNKQTLRLYWQQIRRYKKSFFLMLFLIPIGALLIDTLLPYFLSQAIGEIASNNSEKIEYYLWIGAGVGLTGALCNFIGFRAMVHHEGRVMQQLRNHTFRELISKDATFFSNQKIGAMTSRYIDFVRASVNLQDLLVIRTLGFILSIGSGVVLIAMESLLTAGLILVLVTTLIFQIRWSTKKRAPWRHERKTLIGEIHGSVADSLTNSMIVKTFAGEKREIASLNTQTSRFLTIYDKDFKFISTEGSIRVALMTIIQIAAVAAIANLTASGSVSIATAIFLLAYLQRIGSQLFVLSDIINGYDQAFLDAAPMTEMLGVQNQVSDDPQATTLTLSSPTVAFENVQYRYSDGNEDVLRGVSFAIPAGQKVGMVGHSGAGKSTITQLLLRFSDVTGGAITIDGRDIRSVTQESLRENIAYVPQEPMLFHRTLRENIAYGKPDATDSEVREAARQANALEFIEALEHGLDTTVGERGVKLSGGQRQRIAIARAILKDAPILVLDEATSALDSESEKMIQNALETLMKNRTSIVIAHRLSTIAKLDRIIVLESGAIQEDGTHQELLKQKGIYSTLWSHQSGGFIEE